MKQIMLERLVCPSCGSALDFESRQSWICHSCGCNGVVRNSRPFFTGIAGDIQPFEKEVRAPGAGTPWRQSNWEFLIKEMKKLEPGSVILDIGAGRGDFAAAFDGHKDVLLDVFPYPEIDVVCDLTENIPFRQSSFDAVVLMNVLEHIYKTRETLSAAKYLLKPGGVIIAAVPFLLKVHQSPYDFYRFTHFSLERLARDYDFELVSLDGYYDPVFLLGEGWRNIERWILPGKPRVRRLFARTLITVIKTSAGLLEGILGKGFTISAWDSTSPAPVGYQFVYRKKP